MLFALLAKGINHFEWQKSVSAHAYLLVLALKAAWRLYNPPLLCMQ